MNPTPDQTQVVTTTTYGWITANPAIVVALLFALAGAFFIAIYFIRRSRTPKP